MKQYIHLTLFLMLLPSLIIAQNAITLQDCQQKAVKNYPLIKRYELIEKSKEYNIANAGKGHLPQVSLSAKASYQSEVTKVPISIPGTNIKGLSKDQYSATLDITQNIWDGGVIGSKQEIVKTGTNAEQKQIDVELYSIRNRVNQMYFSILMFDTKIKQNQLFKEELQYNYDRVISYVQNGIANQSDIDVIKVEQLKAEQNTTQLEISRKAYIEMLSTLIGELIDNNSIFKKPDVSETLTSNEIKRPELDLMEAQINNLEAQKKLIKTSYMPKIGLFATGGYGKPGLNMLESDFSPYYIGGIRLSWNFGSLYTQKNEKRLIETDQLSIATQRETFLFNTNIEITQEQNEINKNRELLKYDDEIISLRNNVKKASEVKVANGTMSVTDLLRDINAEDMARQQKIQREIELLLSIYNLKYTTNN